MRKHWFAAVFAALLVIGAGTAIASIPTGGTAAFNIQDPAVTVIAAGQSKITGTEGNPNCAWEAESRTYCPTPELTFTPSVDATCLLNGNLGFVGSPMGEPERLNEVFYGWAVKTEGPLEEEFQDTIVFDEDKVGVMPAPKSLATMPRSRLIPVRAGVKTTFEPYIESAGSSFGVLYWDATYVCFGA